MKNTKIRLNNAPMMARFLLTIISIIILIGPATLALPATDTINSTNSTNTPLPPDLTLTDCIDIALKNNPALSSKSYDLTISQNRLMETKSLRLPSITAYATASTYTEITDSNTPETGDSQFYDVNIQLNQPLYHSGRIANSIKNAKFLNKAANYSFETYKQDLILDVNIAYFNVLQSQRLLEVSQRALKRAQTYSDAANERFKLGVARPADKIKADVETSDAQLDVIKAKNNLLTSRAKLNKILGLPVTKPITIKDLIVTYPNSNNTPQNIDHLIQQASAQLPEIQEINMKINAQQSAVKMAKSDYYPSLNLMASYYRFGSTLSNMQDQWNVGLSLEIPIFKGFARKSRCNQQKARLQAMNKQKEELSQQIAFAVWVDVLKVKETKERISNSQTHLKNARENLRIAEGEYKEGINSMLELIDAQTIFVDAERTYINSLSEFQKARATLERQLGIINKQIQKRHNKQTL